jgi:hypothetical protein
MISDHKAALAAVMNRIAYGTGQRLSTLPLVGLPSGGLQRVQRNAFSLLGHVPPSTALREQGHE